MVYLDRIARFLSRVLLWFGLGAIIAMMLLVVSNVIGRLFDMPVVGTFELVELMGAIVVAGVLAYTALMKRHVAVELVVKRLAPRTQGITGVITALISTVLVFIIAWQAIMIGHRAWLNGHVSDLLEIPIAFFAYFIGCGLAVLGLVFLREVFEFLAKVVRK